MQMTARDEDYRYIATSDLINELVKGRCVLNHQLEGRLTNTVFHTLLDPSEEVSKLAVKW